MNKAWMQKLELLPESEAVKAKLALGICVAVGIILSVALVAREIFAPQSIAILLRTMVSFAFIVTAGVQIMLRPEKQLGRIFILLAIFNVIWPGAFYNGGLNAPVIALTLIIPLLAGILIDKKSAASSLIFCIFFIVAVYFMMAQNLLPEVLIVAPQQLQNARLIVYISMICFTTFVAFVYERERNKSDENLKILLNAHLSGIAKLNSNSKIIYENDKFKDLFAKSSIGKNLHELLVPQTPDYYKFKQMTTLLTLNSSTTLKVNENRWFEFSFVESSNDSNYKILLVTDVTADYQRQILANRLAETDALKAIIVTLNHEINNPLAIATAYVEILMRSQETVDPRLEKTKIALDRVSKVVQQISNLGATENFELEKYNAYTSMLKVSSDGDY